MDTIERRLPKHFDCYFEPFLGGGAVFFRLLTERALLSDINDELINCYRVVRDAVEALITGLRRHRKDRHYFYRVRAQNIEALSDIERAARLMFLNKTNFNGLYRVNSKEQFSVPFSRYKNPRIGDAINLRAVSAIWHSVSIVCAPVEIALTKIRKGDFVYLDPPY